MKLLKCLEHLTKHQVQNKLILFDTDIFYLMKHFSALYQHHSLQNKIVAHIQLLQNEDTTEKSEILKPNSKESEINCSLLLLKLFLHWKPSPDKSTTSFDRLIILEQWALDLLACNFSSISSSFIEQILSFFKDLLSTDFLQFLVNSQKVSFLMNVLLRLQSMCSGAPIQQCNKFIEFMLGNELLQKYCSESAYYKQVSESMNFGRMNKV